MVMGLIGKLLDPLTPIGRDLIVPSHTVLSPPKPAYNWDTSMGNQSNPEKLNCRPSKVKTAQYVRSEKHSYPLEYQVAEDDWLAFIFSENKRAPVLATMKI